MTINFEKKFGRMQEREQFSQSLDEEQFSQVLSAIIDGKYSWACALLLKFTGHDPRNYLPYRTYIRLVKERCQRSEASPSNPKDSPSRCSDSSPTAKKSRRKLADLNHLEPLDDFRTGIFGGCWGFQDWADDFTDRIADELEPIGFPYYS